MAIKVIYVKTIGTCNLNCDHCFTNGRDGDPTQFNIDDTVTWLSDYRRSVGDGHEWYLELHGGEPFLVKLPKLREFVSKVRDIIPDASFGCTSNLTFPLTQGHLDFIQNELEAQIGTSWDPYIRWETDKQYLQWQDSLAKLATLDIHPKVNVTITKNLINDYPPAKFIKTLVDAGVKRVELERLTLNGSAICNAGGLFPDNDAQDLWFQELLEHYQLYEVQKDLAILTIDTLLERLSNNLTEAGTNCRNCEQNLVTINSNGTLSTCPNSAENTNYAHITAPVSEFLNHDLRIDSQVKEQSFDERCISCDVFDVCGGDCHKLPWDTRCGGWKRTLHKLTGRPYEPDLIFKG